MLRSRFLWKLFAGIVALLLGLGAVLMMLGASALKRQSLELQQRELARIAEVSLAWLSSQPEVTDWNGLVGELAEVADANEAQIRVFDEFGTLRGRALPRSGAAEGAIITHSQDISRAGLPAGRIEVSRVRASVRPAFNRLLGLSLAGIGLILLASLWFSHRLTMPIRSVASAADQLSRGSFGSHIAVHSQDEIGALAKAFNEARERMMSDVDTLTQDRNQLDAVLSAMSDGVLAVDVTERVLHINDVAREILGVEGGSAELSGRPVIEVTRDPHVLLALTETLETGKEVHRTFTPSVDTEERTVELSVSVLHREVRRGSESNAESYEDAEIRGAVAVLHDVTKLERLEGLRRDFVSNVSHELKTPLTAIRGFVETLLDSDDVDDETRERFLGRIRLQTNRLSDLVGDLLSLSRIESGKMEISNRPLDIRGIVAEAIPGLKPEGELRGISIELELPDTPVALRAEAESLRQAFANLVSNAVKYSHEGDVVAVRLSKNDSDAIFEVQDSGPGISAEHLERIFERFYRVDKARSRQIGGTGLGLAIVKNVANGLGGRVEVESEPGHGSTFRMLLPLATEP